MNPTQTAWLQVTAGKGPAECAWAVTQVVEQLVAEATAAGIEVRTLELVPGEVAGTTQSTLLALAAPEPLEAFLATWRGTVQVIARSPFRPAHRRKNWFVGVQSLTPVAETRFDARDVRVETTRSGGAGGQHVNTTESAVRVVHVPTGLQAVASEERSQHANRRLAFARLEQRLAERAQAEQAAAGARRWRSHQELERGNPVRTLRAP